MQHEADTTHPIATLTRKVQLLLARVQLLQGRESMLAAENQALKAEVSRLNAALSQAASGLEELPERLGNPLENSKLPVQLLHAEHTVQPNTSPNQPLVQEKIDQLIHEIDLCLELLND